MKSPFDIFLDILEQTFKGSNPVILDVLANVFSMRIIGNKTHGDLAEIALTEYINQYVDGYSAKHTGKEKFRAKEFEEDIRVKNSETGEEFPISIKTYGTGPLQLSTNKDSSMFAYLSETIGSSSVSDKAAIQEILNHYAFADFGLVNVLPLIYNEKSYSFKIVIFDVVKAYKTIDRIEFFPPRGYGLTKSTFPIYKFFSGNQYILEVRYGDAKANALQRGMWTHTENAKPYFRELLTGSYKINRALITLISKILVATSTRHEEILKLFPATENEFEDETQTPLIDA